MSNARRWAGRQLRRAAYWVDPDMKMTIIGCDFYPAPSFEGEPEFEWNPDDFPRNGVYLTPGSSMAPRGLHSVIELRHGTVIRSLAGGGTVIEVTDKPDKYLLATGEGIPLPESS